MRSKAHTALTAPLVLHHTRIYKCAMKKFVFNCQMRNEPFLIVIYHSSLVKGAMNAERVCKLRNGVKTFKMQKFRISDCLLRSIFSLLPVNFTSLSGSRMSLVMMKASTSAVTMMSSSLTNSSSNASSLNNTRS
jgi:hypothetical protein